jgi:hypothetical protein
MKNTTVDVRPYTDFCILNSFILKTIHEKIEICREAAAVLTIKKYVLMVCSLCLSIKRCLKQINFRLPHTACLKGPNTLGVQQAAFRVT